MQNKGYHNYLATVLKQILENMCNKVYFRKNEGFDAGAYSDTIVNEIGKEELGNWK